MPFSKWLKAFAVTLACVGMLVPVQCLRAQQPEPDKQLAATIDVALSDDGTLNGLVVDGFGHPKAGFPIRIQQFETSVASVVSDAGGAFRCNIQNGGMYLLAAGDQVVMLRCWAPGTAPPHAKDQVVVQAGDVLRGQISPASGLSNPWIITGLAVTAIVVPIVLHNNRADRENGSE